MKSKKYWCIFLFILFLLPIGINALYLYDAWSTIFEAPSEWTKFWGGYLGSIISSIVAFVILHIQRKDNEQENKANRTQNTAENKANRIQNKAENEANRKLTIYQLERQRIDNVRNVYTQYMTLINTNDLLELALQIKDSYPPPIIARNFRKPNDDFKKATILVSLYPLQKNSNTSTFIQKRTEFENSYHFILNDFHALISWSTMTDLDLIAYKANESEKISTKLKEIIENTEKKSTVKEFLYECAGTLVKKHAEEEHKKMCSEIMDYIQNEFKLLDATIK